MVLPDMILATLTGWPFWPALADPGVTIFNRVNPIRNPFNPNASGSTAENDRAGIWTFQVAKVRFSP